MEYILIMFISSMNYPHFEVERFATMQDCKKVGEVKYDLGRSYDYKCVEVKAKDK